LLRSVLPLSRRKIDIPNLSLIFRPFLAAWPTAKAAHECLRKPVICTDFGVRHGSDPCPENVVKYRINLNRYADAREKQRENVGYI